MLPMCLLLAVSCRTFGALRAALFWWRQPGRRRRSSDLVQPTPVYYMHIVAMQVISLRTCTATDEKTRSALSHCIKNSMIRGLELPLCWNPHSIHQLGTRNERAWYTDTISAPWRVDDIPIRRPCLIDCRWYFERRVELFLSVLLFSQLTLSKWTEHWMYY